MTKIRDLVESHVRDAMERLEEQNLTESVQVDRFIEVRGMSNFRVKFLVKGTSRVVYVQTDRREFIKAIVAGRRLSEVERFLSLSEVEEDTRQVIADGYRLVNNQSDAMPIVRAVLSGLSRRSATLSTDELIVVSMMSFIDRMIVDIDDSDEYDIGIGAYELRSMGSGWMVVRQAA
jgi:hypothetical protein